MVLTSLYIHVPFCTHRCGYCDFNSYAGLEQLIPAYAQAVCQEIQFLSKESDGRLIIHTVYFGGGTPSLVSARDLGKIIASIKENFDITQLPEITIEANPGTLTENYLQNIHQLGINRISLGMQSALEDELRLLERQHSFEDVVKAVEWCRNAGFTNLNLDLIFGLPRQTLQAWLKSLEAAIAIHPEHFSLYALTIEHGTPLQHKVKIGLYPEPDSDVAADMYETARMKLAEAGYAHYEISNWSKIDDAGKILACVHNIQYWRNQSYLGVGAGAHGFINHYRTVNISTPNAYIQNMVKGKYLAESTSLFPRTPATVELNPINAETEIGETMMMGLRLVEEGVSSIEFQQRFGIGLQDKFGPQIDRFISYGLLEWTKGEEKRLRLTQEGQLLGNQVFKEFI
jgi:oxygen-independent coproporphyrinogen-3 oxidase